MVQNVHFPASKVRQSLAMSTPLRRRSSGFIIFLGEDPLLLEGELLFGDVAKCSLRAEFALRSRGCLPVAMAMLKVKPSVVGLQRWCKKVPSPASRVRQSLAKSTPLREACRASPSPCGQILGCQRANCCLAMLPKCFLRAEFPLRSRGSLPVAMAMLKVKPSVVGRQRQRQKVRCPAPKVRQSLSPSCQNPGEKLLPVRKTGRQVREALLNRPPYPPSVRVLLPVQSCFQSLLIQSEVLSPSA